MPFCLDRFNQHPWRDTLLKQHEITQEIDIQIHFGQMHQELQKCDEDGRRLYTSVYGKTQSPSAEDDQNATTFAQLHRSLDIVAAALDAPTAPLQKWLQRAHATELLAIVADAHLHTTDHEEGAAQLFQFYDESLLAENLEEVQEAFTVSSLEAVNRLIGNSTRSPYDAALADRSDLNRILTDGASAITDMIAEARNVAQDLDLGLPKNAEGTANLSKLSESILQTPRPPRIWLDAASFPSISVQIVESEERARRVTEARDRLKGIYVDALLTQDITQLEDRFRTRYGSVLRILSRQYYADIRSVKSYIRTDIGVVKRTVHEMAADLQVAKQLIEDEQWLREHRTELAGTLGRFYDIRGIDWDAVFTAVTWTRSFHEACARVLAGGQPSEAMLQVVTVGGATLETLRLHSARLATALRQWQVVAPDIQARFRVAILTPTAPSADTAPMESLLSGLLLTATGLRALWDGWDTLMRHRIASSKSAEPPNWSVLCQELELARHVLAVRDWLSDHDAEFAAQFGSIYEGFATPWDTLDKTLRWAHDLASRFDEGIVSASLAKFICVEANPQAQEELRDVHDMLLLHLDALTREISYFEQVLPLPSLCPSDQAFEECPIQVLAENVQILIDTLPELERLLASRQHIQDCRDAGLGSLLDAALNQHPFPQNIVSIFEQRFYSLWLDAARAQSRELARFSGEHHDTTIERYRKLDQEHLALARKRLYTQLQRQSSAALVRADAGRNSPQGQALTRLRQLAGQKRPRGSIRQIVRSIAPILLELKPCWMMSPLSVSQYVEESWPIFDLVIFDEASQVRPEDAISAILRGRRLVVVGDSKQLPPTQFFTKEHRDEEDDDDEAEEWAPENGRRESILEECRSTGMQERSLLWHYRSHHESLIAFSNHHFYDDKLITFPNPGDAHSDGVRFEYVANAIYGYGASRTNLEEAERVVDLVIEHLHERPQLSLGIVALSSAQQEAIESALESRCKTDPEVEALVEGFNDESPNSLFIKNLESVQGDERDVIILSIGYGRDNTGRVRRYHFGPVNRSGGARRLNVAVTRAREQMIIVSSLRASDLPSSLPSEGPRILRAYLDYAERGMLAIEQQQDEYSDIQFDSPFEEAVYNALTKRGLRLATQVGCSGYRIDLAVRDPHVPSRFLLGIECDGRNYHSAKTARDRDRLRQGHLERMGWVIHRIWSSDWRRDPEGQTARIIERVREITSANRS